MNNNVKALKCKVCGHEFNPSMVARYTAVDDKEVGLSVALSRTKEPKLYDAFDCPLCGCQVVAQERKRRQEESTEEHTVDLPIHKPPVQEENTEGAEKREVPKVAGFEDNGTGYPFIRFVEGDDFK